MKTPRLILTLAFLLARFLPAAASAESQPIDLAAADLGPAVERVDQDADTILRIDNKDGTKGPRLILEIEAPNITQDSYALLGEIRHEGVVGEGYLETWNHFPAVAGGRDIDASYFTRTMGESGPMGKIRGDANWRPFSLPFILSDNSDRRPLKLTWNLHLEGPGIVELRNIRLLDGLPGNPVRESGWWWSARTSGIFAAVLGVLFGVWSFLARYLASRRSCPGFVRASFLLWIALGSGALAYGVVALVTGQPFFVYLLPLLIGGLAAGVGALELHKLKKTETERELRRIRAADI